MTNNKEAIQFGQEMMKQVSKYEPIGERESSHKWATHLIRAFDTLEMKSGEVRETITDNGNFGNRVFLLVSYPQGNERGYKIYTVSAFEKNEESEKECVLATIGEGNGTNYVSFGLGINNNSESRLHLDQIIRSLVPDIE